MDNLSLPSFSKKSVIPCFVKKTRCHSILRIIIKFHSPLRRNTEYQTSFPGLSDIPNVIPRFIGIRNIKCHSPVYRNTEYQVSFPGWPDYGSLLKFSFLKCHSPVCRNTEYQMSFPSLSEYGISNVIPQVIEIQNIKCHSPVYRNTEYQVSFPSWPDYGSSLKFSFLKCHSAFVGGRNVKNVIPSVPSPEMSPIKMSVSTNYRFTNTFQNFQCLFKILSSFHLSSFNYRHGSGQSLSPVKLKHPLAESGPFLQRIWISLFIPNKSSCHSTFIITS